MKIFKALIIALVAMTCTSAAAQSNFFNYGKNNIIVGFNSFDSKNLEDPLTGLRIGYSRIFELSQNTPVFLEASALIQVGMIEYEESLGNLNTSSELSFGGLNIPVNIGYLFNIGESGFAIAPKAGFNLSYNVLGETKNEINGSSETIDWFDTYDAKRITIGWQIGAEASYKHIVLGFQYGQDFNELVKDSEGNIKFKHFSVNLAYRF